MNKPIINMDELEFHEFGKGEKFHAARAEVGRNIGASKLGYAVITLQPGKRAWPYHSHYVLEEFFFVLNGSGTLRHADEEYPVRKGDFICSPADPKQPHQIINTSDEPMTYIALSNVEEADIFLYPDSGKYGAWHSKTNRMDDPDKFVVFARKDTAVDYWDGEVED
jgi:uncharacterized cupin superfamily protein